MTIPHACLRLATEMQAKIKKTKTETKTMYGLLADALTKSQRQVEFNIFQTFLRKVVNQMTR